MIQNEFLIDDIDLWATDAEQPEDLDVLFLGKLIVVTLIDEAVGEIFNDFLGDKVTGKKVIFFEEFLEESQLAGNIASDDIF